jgi:hypothetical protein
MKGSAAAQATQSSRVKPRPVIEKAPKLLQLRLILVDHDALANVRFGTEDSDVPCQALNARLIALLLPFWLEGLGDGSCRGEGGT